MLGGGPSSCGHLCIFGCHSLHFYYAKNILIWGPGIYIALYDYPDIVHQLLALVTETYIHFMRELKKTMADEDGEYVYHKWTLYRGKAVVRNDTAVNLSPEAYEEFAKPYDERIFRELDGGAVHYCGRAEHWIFRMMECTGLRGLNFGQPPGMNFGFEFLQRIYNAAKARKITIVDYDMEADQIREIPNSHFTTGITYCTNVQCKAEAIKLLEAISR